MGNCNSANEDPKTEIRNYNMRKDNKKATKGKEEKIENKRKRPTKDKKKKIQSDKKCDTKKYEEYPKSGKNELAFQWSSYYWDKIGKE